MLDDKVKIIVKGKDETANLCEWSEIDNKIRIVYSSGKAYSYNPENVQILRSVLSDKRAGNCFDYLKHIAKEIGLENTDGEKILFKQYEKIDFIGKDDNILAAFLTGVPPKKTKVAHNIAPIYPFSFNISQKTAIDYALQNKKLISKPHFINCTSH